MKVDKSQIIGWLKELWGRNKKYILNKYFILFAIFIGNFIYVSNEELGTRWGNNRKIVFLQAEIAKYEKEIERSKEYINSIRSNDDDLERFARENYLMKKENEDIFIINE